MSRLHDTQRRYVVVSEYDDGTKLSRLMTGRAYAIELAEAITLRKSRVPLLRVSVIDYATGESVFDCEA